MSGNPNQTKKLSVIIGIPPPVNLLLSQIKNEISLWMYWDSYVSVCFTIVQLFPLVATNYLTIILQISVWIVSMLVLRSDISLVFPGCIQYLLWGWCIWAHVHMCMCLRMCICVCAHVCFSIKCIRFLLHHGYHTFSLLCNGLKAAMTHQQLHIWCSSKQF